MRKLHQKHYNCKNQLKLLEQDNNSWGANTFLSKSMDIMKGYLFILQPTWVFIIKYLRMDYDQIAIFSIVRTLGQ
jgi:hypothetical protein